MLPTTPHQRQPRRALCLDCPMTAAGPTHLLQAATGDHIFRTGHRVVDEHGDRLDLLAECARCSFQLKDAQPHPEVCPRCEGPAAWFPVGLQTIPTEAA